MRALLMLVCGTLLGHLVNSSNHESHENWETFKNLEISSEDAENKQHARSISSYSYEVVSNFSKDFRTILYPKHISIDGSCEVFLWQGEGSISSRNYPFNYPASSECSYRVPRVDFSSCALELTFQDFDLEAGETKETCEHDYLQVGNRKLCGYIPVGHKEIVEFPYNMAELILKFKSDGAENKRGFKIEIQRIYKSCYQLYTPVVPNLSVSTVQGRLTSYGYPDYYRENTNCTYIIEKQPGFCSVELEFVDFDVEEGPYGCTRDYFVMEGSLHCGSTLRGRKVNIEFGGSKEISLNFLTDGNTGNRGFDIRYKQVACVGPPIRLHQQYRMIEPPPLISKESFCDSKYSDWDIRLRSPEYPSFYASDVDCTYTIHRASVDVCELEFTFLHFDVEYDRLCRGDFIEINGDKICGPLPDGTTRRVRFYGSDIVVRFQTDDTVNRPGFEILVKQKTDCSSSAPLKITSYDPVGHSYCDEYKSSQEFFLQSDNYPNQSGDLMDCVYIISKFSQQVCELQLTFLAFDLQEDGNCDYDYLEIDGKRLCGNAHHGTIRRIKFDKPEIVIRFHSDRSYLGRGFQIFAQQRRDCEQSIQRSMPLVPTVEYQQAYIPPPACDAVFTDANFRLRSLNYPRDYPNNLDCELRVQRLSSNVCELQLTFNAFHIEDDPGCRYDYLEVNGQRSCGYIPEGTVRFMPFLSSENVIRFRTDHSTTSSGFDITVEQKKCRSPSLPKLIAPPPIEYPLAYAIPSTMCDQEFTTWEFFFQSVNFPLNYGVNVDCTYRAHKFSPSVCEIELHFMTFDTEFHPDCAKDYLEVEGERFCGTIAPGTVRKFKYDRPEFLIRFHADHTTSGVGYNILVRQKTSCPASAPANVVLVREPASPVLVVPTARLVPRLETVPLYDFVLSQPSSQFTSLGYPGNYGHGTNCTYRISRAKNICAVELYFYDFDVQSSLDCRKDYLTFGGKRYCGNELKGQTRMLYFEHNSEAVLSFVTDESKSEKGWWLFYKQIPCPDIKTSIIESPSLCDDSFDDEVGFIKSRNFPLTLYSSEEDCYYRIKRSSANVCSLELFFTDFALESSTGCENDYLEIDRQRYCGTDLWRKTVYIDFKLGSDDILLHFRSNRDKEDRGFFFQVRQLSHSCRQQYPALPAVSLQFEQQVTNAKNLCDKVWQSELANVRSPKFPSSYPENSDCTYTVVRANPSVCGLELSFRKFALETSQMCQYDYLQTPSGDRMCGNTWTGVARAVPFPIDEDKLVFVFHSDSRIQDQGFDFDIRQLVTGCP